MTTRHHEAILQYTLLAIYLLTTLYWNARTIGLVGYCRRMEGLFVLLAILSLSGSVAVWRIRETNIDHELARGEGPEDKQVNPHGKQTGIQAIVGTRSTYFFALAVLWFFASETGLQAGRATPQEKLSTPA